MRRKPNTRKLIPQDDDDFFDEAMQHEKAPEKKVKLSALDQQTIDELYDKREYEHLAKLALRCKSNYIQYRKLKYNNIIYNLGDNASVKVLNGDNVFHFIAKLVRFLNVKCDDESQLIALVHVQWYYSKIDINGVYPNYQDCFSDSELFLTEKQGFVSVEDIQHKCQVLNFEEFEKSEYDKNIDTYFTRSQYNARSKTMIPSPDTWRKSCICQKPQNPDEVYVMCSLCEDWIHIHCAGLTEEQANTIENYECKKCSKKNGTG